MALLLLSVLTFGLSRLTPDDPVRQRMAAEGIRTNGSNLTEYERNYGYLARKMGFDLPVFYLTVTNASLPDTLHRVAITGRREALRSLARNYGNWPAVQRYYTAVLRGRNAPESGLRAVCRRLLERTDPAYVQRQLSGLATTPAAGELLEAYRTMQRDATPQRLLVPRVHWNGLENQYHHYLRDLYHLELGRSYTDRRPVAAKISMVLPRTLILNGAALLLVYLLAVPLGLYMAHYRGRAFDRVATWLTFLAFGIPSFWVATLLANFFTTEAYGMDYFHSSGFVEVAEGTPWWRVVGLYAEHLFLPVLCLTYPSLAYVARHLRSAAILELDKPYVRTARMKGLASSQVLWRHVFRNASFPLITLLGGLLPGLLAGSVLIERIFDIPGMGRLLYDSVSGRDWPVVIALVLLNGLLTILGLLLADLGYALVDPRIRLGKLPPR